LFVLSCFVGNCPSKIQENGKKNLSPKCQKLGTARAYSGTARAYSGTARAYSGTGVPDHALHTHKNQKLGTARACSGTAMPDP